MNIKKYNIETGVCEIIKGCGEKLGDYIVNKTCTVLAASIHDDEWVVFFDLVNKQVMYNMIPETIGGDKRKNFINDHLVTDDGRYLIFSHMLVPPVLKGVKDAESTELVVVWNIPDNKIHQILYDEEYAIKYHHMDVNETDIDEMPDISVNDLHILDEKTVITTNDDYFIRVYDIKTGNLLHRLTGHFSNIKLVLNKDSPFLLSYANWSEENCIRLWDRQTFHCLASYCIETKIKTPMFSSDGYHIIVTYKDVGYVRFHLKGGDSISKYQPPKQLDQYKELFKPTDEIVELKIPNNITYDNPDPDTDELEVADEDGDDDDFDCGDSSSYDSSTTDTDEN
ncbi:uncharacterized protein LOC126829320 [Patella vulgata]|uniref:uncharacterized protein LOC126829320 n=1 Tax=Patella vulgata TaxID=6465 RepID=UPI0024A81212|nr:uncharacterized protein LOC126829320 [Patella vulgata]